jgi:hypothetical protein
LWQKSYLDTPLFHQFIPTGSIGFGLSGILPENKGFNNLKKIPGASYHVDFRGILSVNNQ